MAWIRNESGSIVPFRRSILPNKPFLATLRCLSLSLSLSLTFCTRDEFAMKPSRPRSSLTSSSSTRDNIESPAGIIFFRGWTWLNRHRCGGTNEESRTGRRPFKRANRRRGGVRRDARQLRGKCNFMPRFPSFPLLLLPSSASTGGQEILETSRVAREEEMRQFFRQTTRVKTAKRGLRGGVSLITGEREPCVWCLLVG